ncbi:hypothetical protein SLEP1_g56886 [Rubroshorea leprosula]|uniref:Yippee domain-containing protein n=1 Tax=Rubroshorea leprosula TaxID=152421 RepID=A0AAV5ML32_9ROSI|nr:hypothetical protein SLEP1_g56886 [Rubroshorea leprosula]
MNVRTDGPECYRTEGTNTVTNAYCGRCNLLLGTRVVSSEQPHPTLKDGRLLLRFFELTEHPTAPPCQLQFSRLLNGEETRFSAPFLSVPQQLWRFTALSSWNRLNLLLVALLIGDVKDLVPVTWEEEVEAYRESKAMNGRVISNS